MAISESQALALLSVDDMKLELRIPLEIFDHDGLLARQITDAFSFASETTGREGADLGELRQAAVAIVRAQYDGEVELPKSTTFDTWMDPFRSIAG